MSYKSFFFPSPRRCKHFDVLSVLVPRPLIFPAESAVKGVFSVHLFTTTAKTYLFAGWRKVVYFSFFGVGVILIAA
jgi:hypothetical protein